MDSLLQRSIKSFLQTSVIGDGSTTIHWELWKTGMLRLDLNERTVLHIWDHRYYHPKVTMVHDHPFFLKSRIVAGKLGNVRYIPHGQGDVFWKAKIQCGVGACMIQDPVRIHLIRHSTEEYSPGDSYQQFAEEIHETKIFPDGAVTMVTRDFGSDRDNAHVYIPDGLEWGDAFPRLATNEEVTDIIQRALQLF